MREIFGGGLPNLKEAPRSGKKEYTVGSVTMINDAMSSTLMG
jgi:hypothetical protein